MAGDRKPAVQSTSRTKTDTGAYSDTARIYRVSPPPGFPPSRPSCCRVLAALWVSIRSGLHSRLARRRICRLPVEKVSSSLRGTDIARTHRARDCVGISSRFLPASYRGNRGSFARESAAGMRGREYQEAVRCARDIANAAYRTPVFACGLRVLTSQSGAGICARRSGTYRARPGCTQCVRSYLTFVYVRSTRPGDGSTVRVEHATARARESACIWPPAGTSLRETPGGVSHTRNLSPGECTA